MKINKICPLCNTTIQTNLSQKEVDLSNHVERAHPLEYKDAVEIAEQVGELIKELYLLTGCRNIHMFPNRAVK